VYGKLLWHKRERGRKMNNTNDLEIVGIKVDEEQGTITAY
jgi:hypothetical protein